MRQPCQLAQEARAGLSEFRIPPELENLLLDCQVAAVKIAAPQPSFPFLPGTGAAPSRWAFPFPFPAGVRPPH